MIVIIIIIIIVLKSNLKVNLRQDLDHGLGGPTRVNPSQCTNKNCYYHSFKT